MSRTGGNSAAGAVVTRLNLCLIAPLPNTQCLGVSGAAVSYFQAPGRALEITIKQHAGDADAINGEERQ